MSFAARISLLALAVLGFSGVARAEEAVVAAAAPARRVHLTVDATATYGIGGYSALGVQLHAVGQIGAWEARAAAGSFDVGLVLGFQDEPQFLQYAVAKGLTNDAQRLNAWATVGHTFHLGRERRAGLGLHLFGGWTHVWSQARIARPDLALSASAADDYGLLNVGGMLKFDYRFSRFLGFTVQAVGPFPVQPSMVSTLFHVGVGLTGYIL